MINTFGEPSVLIEGRPAAQVTVDLTELEIESFHLDLDEGLLMLSYNDVQNSTFDPRGIVLQSNAYSTNREQYQLTSLSSDGFHYIIQIGENDLNNIKAFPGVATSADDTFLVRLQLMMCLVMMY